VEFVSGRVVVGKVFPSSCHFTQCMILIYQPDLVQQITMLKASVACYFYEKKVKMVHERSLLLQVCHIVLGLRPVSREEEGDIVKGWLEREERRGYRVGQFWYLIAMDWWRTWTDYVTYRVSMIHCLIYCFRNFRHEK
jgi:ubiquitin carboxyl-terminal hydrolase 6/32